MAAYTFWGVAPIYFVVVSFALPLEILAHRILWALPLLAMLVTISRTWPQLHVLERSAYVRLGICSVLLSINWLTFIYAILDGRIAETALGYFINPIVSIMLGWLFLQEHLRPAQWFAALLAAVGVLTELLWIGELPVLGLLLAVSFGLYGLVRKQIQVPAALGLGIETTLLVPFAAAFLIYLHAHTDMPLRSAGDAALLALGGVVTVVPLVWFGAAAARLPLTILGFFQYLAPSISLVIAVLVYHEHVTAARWFNLGLIWLALLVFSGESYYQSRVNPSSARG